MEMRITTTEVIRNGEQELFDGITAELDWTAIEEIFKKEHNLAIEEEVAYKRGDIVVHNDEIAYKLQFEVKVALSVLLNREGNYISVSTSEIPDRADAGIESEHNADAGTTQDEFKEVLEEFHTDDHPETESTGSAASGNDAPQQKISRIASQASELIDEMHEDG